MTPEQPEEQARPSMPPVPRDAPASGPAAPGHDPFEPYHPYEPYGSAEDGGEVRAAERSAERAADLAAAEGFHPLRIRPYVSEPGAGSAETTVRPLLVGTVVGHGPDTADLGLFSERYAGREYPQDHDGGHPGYDDRDPYGDEAGEDAQAVLRGRHRRRRRGFVVAAAAVAASALAAGAVAMTGQVMSDEQGSTGYALPDTGSAAPDVTLPADAEPATATTAAAVTQRAATTPRTVPAAVSASPAPSTGAPRSPGTTQSPAAAPTATATPAATATATATTPGPTPTPPAATTPSGGNAPATAQILQLGDTGSSVADLQTRLAEVWVYHGPIDGVFDADVQRAVATFQVWYWVSDAADGSHDGVYGPHTRAALERQTSGWGGHQH
ncbi:peptidoglycan-binding domain-containing protein [Streptomyces sp. V4-01]|uniref:Peptidoglycan-binding domain-containing protein n=1 Tax=Actinacidiphila polyblastidii TaxID=3110430 RepID=A0ABU7PDH2_9ACTN|nr:peptidoglycan-binding domain-containing protein [Streptomyces sp. V4-01]